jgi:hypothetical protein
LLPRRRHWEKVALLAMNSQSGRKRPLSNQPVAVQQQQRQQQHLPQQCILCNTVLELRYLRLLLCVMCVPLCTVILRARHLLQTLVLALATTPMCLQRVLEAL